MTILMTVTGRCWPRRWIRSMAWYSTDGFHCTSSVELYFDTPKHTQESIMKTLDASVRFCLASAEDAAP